MSSNTTERRAMRPALSGIRNAPFATRAAAEAGDGWTLDGYGAVFNRLTVIDSWEGMFREKIANRSMNRSFRESPPIVQFDHGRHPLIGSFPIAELVSVREDVDATLAPEGGAHIIANIFRHLFFEPLREAIKAKAVSGMSFRFEVVREKWETADGKLIRDDEELLAELRKTWRGDVPEDELPIRTLQELRVPEMGPVVWPAYADTSVGVRSINLDDLDQDEDQRIALARKLWAVPKLTASTDAGGESNDSRNSEQGSQDDDAQQGTPQGAAEHPSTSDTDAQRGTPEGVAEHPSNDDMLRKSWRYRMDRQNRECEAMTKIASKGLR